MAIAGCVRHDRPPAALRTRLVSVPVGALVLGFYFPNYGGQLLESLDVRFEFGVRYWLVDQWKGYTTIDKHLKATTHMID